MSVCPLKPEERSGTYGAYRRHSVKAIPHNACCVAALPDFCQTIPIEEARAPPSADEICEVWRNRGKHMRNKGVSCAHGCCLKIIPHGSDGADMPSDFSVVRQIEAQECFLADKICNERRKRNMRMCRQDVIRELRYCYIHNKIKRRRSTYLSRKETER